MRVKRILWSVLLALLLVSGLAAAQEVLGDDWYVIEQDGVASGYGRDQWYKTEDGYYFSSFFELNLEFLGTAYVHLEHIDAWTDADYRLIKVLRISSIDGAQTRHEAVFTYHENSTEIAVTNTDTTGTEKTRVIELAGATPIYLSDSFLAKLFSEGKLAVGQTYTFAQWELDEVVEMEMRIDEVKAFEYAGEAVEVFVVFQDTGSLEATVWVDAEGHTYHSESLGGSLVIRKVDPNNLPELQTMAADVLMVPGNIAVQNPHRSEASLITVEWKDIPLGDLSLTDNRQTITQSLSNTSVQLAIKREERDFTGQVLLPVQDPTFAPYLADTDYISPSNPEVQNLVEEILAGETDGWQAAQLILAWVYNNITARLVARNLTTEEILAERAGKCAEYATLYAALARAAGLPTKLVVGERYMGSMWIAHMWNEIWLGEWIAVDASHNQIAPDALLVKFTADDTLIGTRDIRLRLVSKLSITIDEVKMAELGMGPAVKTGRDGQTYYNAEYYCEIAVPEGWITMEGEDQGFPLLILENPRDRNFSAILVMMGVPKGTRADQIMAARIAAMPTLLPNFKFIGEGTAVIQGELAAAAYWAYGNEPRLKQANQLLIKEDVAYIFIFTALEEVWEDYEYLIETITAGFKSYL